MSAITLADDDEFIDENNAESVRRHSARLKSKFARAVAIDDNAAREIGELPFRKGDVVFVLEKSTPSVWKVRASACRARARSMFLSFFLLSCLSTCVCAFRAPFCEFVFAVRAFCFARARFSLSPF